MAAPRVLCDAMLGRLARKLRLLGVDAAYHRGDDRSFVERALAERRLPITRDRQLLASRDLRRASLAPVDPASDDYHEQLARVAAALGALPRREPRCPECNAPLFAVDRRTAAGLVPAYVALTAPSFRICPSCRRVFWRGTHVDHFLRDLRPCVAPPTGSRGSR